MMMYPFYMYNPYSWIHFNQIMYNHMFQFNPLFSGYLGQQYMATLPFLEPYTMKNFTEKNISSGA